MSKHAYRIKFRELNKGRDGGSGKIKAFQCFAASPKKALRKLRKRGNIISIRKI